MKDLWYEFKYDPWGTIAMAALIIFLILLVAFSALVLIERDRRQSECYAHGYGQLVQIDMEWYCARTSADGVLHTIRVDQIGE